jgi:hypothetical protein
MGGEGFPCPNPTSSNTADKAQLQKWGYTPTLWAAWQKEMMTAYKSYFSYAVVIYPMNGNDTDPATGLPVQVENAEWAAANGFGVGQQGLYPGETSPVFLQLRSKYPQLYIQYQTLNAVGSVAGVQADIQTAYKNGAQFIEWYSNDIVNSANLTYFAQWQQMVGSKYPA